MGVAWARQDFRIDSKKGLLCLLPTHTSPSTAPSASADATASSPPRALGSPSALAERASARAVRRRGPFSGGADGHSYSNGVLAF